MKSAPKSHMPIRSFVEHALHDIFLAQVRRLAVSDPGHRLVHLESLAAIVKFDNVNDLLGKMQNGLPDGLSVGVLTKNISTALHVTRNITAANVW